MMNAFLLPKISTAINRYLSLDPESTRRIQSLSGKAISIELLPFHFTFQCIFTADGIDVKADEALATDTKISGTPLQMLGVMLTKENRHQFFADDLRIEGNAEFGQQVVELFDNLHIDWEEHLARCTGDVPAHQFGRLIRGMGQWLRKAETSFTQDINEYVHEEAGWFPVREALQDFFTDIDTLRMDVDRMDARIKHIRTLLNDDEVSQ